MAHPIKITDPLVLPETLSRKQILKANSKKVKINKEREYKFDDLNAVAPPYVFTPGGTSENIFKLIKRLGEEILKNKRVGIMGVGLGVENVLLEKYSVKEIHAFDIHPQSIEATISNFRKNVSKSRHDILTTYVSDLFEKYKSNRKFDFIFFNPPAVSVEVSSDNDVVRNTSVGSSIMYRFLDQIKTIQLLSSRGQVIFTISNTSELRSIVSYALELGYDVEVLETINYDKPYEDITTYIFSLTL